MYRNQKGFKPFGQKILTFLFYLLFFGAYISSSDELFQPEDSIWLRSGIFLLLVLSLLFGSSVLLSKYPNLKFSREGIHYKYFIFFGGLIRWEEIYGLKQIDYPKSMRGVYAFMIDRKGYIYPFWFKGLYFPTMHSMQVRTSMPVILMTPETITEDERRKIKEIIANPDIFEEV